MRRATLRLAVQTSLSILFPLLLSAQRGSRTPDLFFPPELTAQSEIESIDPSLYSTTIPFLPIIFFDQPGSSTIPERYTPIGEGLDAKKLAPIIRCDQPESVLAPHHNIFNVLLSRLYANEKATITLTGCYSDEEGESRAVALMRANVVKARLLEREGIGPERVFIGEPRQILPNQDFLPASLERFREEARRVEISSNEFTLLEEMVVAVQETMQKKFQLEFTLKHHFDSLEVLAIAVETWIGGEQVGYTYHVPEDGQSLYRFTGLWEVPKRIMSRHPGHIVLQSTLHMRDGSSHESNPLTLPLKYNRVKPLRAESAIYHTYPRGARERTVGTLFFDGGAQDISPTIGITPAQITSQLPRGPLSLRLYHPIDPEEMLETGGKDQPASFHIQERPAWTDQDPDDKIRITLHSGWQPARITGHYEGGLIGLRLEGEPTAKSNAPFPHNLLAEGRTLTFASRLEDAIEERRKATEADLLIINPRRLRSVRSYVQRVQGTYPENLPEGRLYRRAVRVALR